MSGLRTVLMWVIALASGGQSSAETIVGVASWEVQAGGPTLIIKVDEHLSKKQVTLVNSGFSTYSDFVVTLPAGKFTPEMAIFKSQCTVKYDTWEEIYDIVRIDKDVNLTQVKDFKTFAEHCLKASIKNHKALDYFAKHGGQLRASLKLDQISQERAQKIRKWLIKQQSGVVKGLFSHMLGDLQVSESLVIKIQIPPYAMNLDTEEDEVISIYPKPPKKKNK